jgi:hypothetical protein
MRAIDKKVWGALRRKPILLITMMLCYKAICTRPRIWDPRAQSDHSGLVLHSKIYCCTIDLIYPTLQGVDYYIYI